MSQDPLVALADIPASLIRQAAKVRIVTNVIDGVEDKAALQDGAEFIERALHVLTQIRDHSTDVWAKGLAQQIVGPAD